MKAFNYLDSLSQYLFDISYKTHHLSIAVTNSKLTTPEFLRFLIT